MDNRILSKELVRIAGLISSEDVLSSVSRTALLGFGNKKDNSDGNSKLKEQQYAKNRTASYRKAGEINDMNVLGAVGNKKLLGLKKEADKFNALRQDAISITGDDSEIYYDNSSTWDMGPSFIGPVSISVDRDSVVMTYEYESYSGWEKRRTTYRSFAKIEEGDFDDYDFKDELRYMSRCVKRAIRYFNKHKNDSIDDE